MLACRRRFDSHTGGMAPLAAVLAAVLCAGCGVNLPSTGSSALTTGSIDVNKAGAGPVGKDCNIEFDSGRSTTVQSILESARAVDRDVARNGKASQPASSPDCAAARTRAQFAAISREPTEAANTTGMPAELTIEFNGDEERLASKDKPAVSNFIAGNRAAGRKLLRIYAGRGGAGNVFEQAVLAQKRARAVQAIVPSNLVVSVEFDPALADDTVRLEFHKG